MQSLVQKQNKIKTDRQEEFLAKTLERLKTAKVKLSLKSMQSAARQGITLGKIQAVVNTAEVFDLRDHGTISLSSPEFPGVSVLVTGLNGLLANGKVFVVGVRG